MKKEKKEKITKSYVDKPNFNRYVRAIKSSRPEVRKKLYQVQKSQEGKYAKQEAEIKLGLKKSRIESAQQRVEKGIKRVVGKALKSKITSRKILKKSKTSYKMPDKPVTSVWGDENRFFKGAIQNEF